jgi:single-strand DNA-binding protein
LHFNSIVLSGRVVARPEMKYTQAGAGLLIIKVEADDEYEGRDGGKRSTTLKVDAIVWGKPATALKDSLHVGDEVILNGKLQSREWESKSGFTNVAHSISCEKLKVLRHANDEIKATAAAPTPAENHSGVAGSDNEELPF